MTEKQALKIHGYVFSSGDDSSNSDSGKSEFDDEYYASRPPPVPLQGLENRIVKIKALSISVPKSLKKDGVEGKSPSTQQNAILDRKATQKNRATRQRRRARPNNVSPPERTNGANSPIDPSDPIEVGHNRKGILKPNSAIEQTNTNIIQQPIANQPSGSINRRGIQHKNEPLGHTNRMQNHPEHQNPWINSVNSSAGSSNYIPVNKLNQYQRLSTMQNPFRVNQNSFMNDSCTVITSREIGGNSQSNVNPNRVPSKKSTSADKSLGNAVATNQRTNLPRPVNYAEAAKSSVIPKSSAAQGLPAHKPPSSGFTTNTSNRSSTTSRSNEREEIFTIFSAEPVRSGGSIHRIQDRNRGSSSTITSQPFVHSARSSIVRDEVVTPQEDGGFLYALRKFFCCEVDDHYSHI